MTDKFFDPDFVISLVGDDYDFIVELLNRGSKKIPIQLKDIRMAMVRDENIEASKIAHNLKSNLRTIGLNPIADVAQELETELASNQMTMENSFICHKILEQIEKYLECAREEISEWKVKKIGA